MGAVADLLLLLGGAKAPGAMILGQEEGKRFQPSLPPLPSHVSKMESDMGWGKS